MENESIFNGKTIDSKTFRLWLCVKTEQRSSFSLALIVKLMIQVLVGNVFALKKKIVRLLPIIIALHFDLIANRNEMNIQDN